MADMASIAAILVNMKYNMMNMTGMPNTRENKKDRFHLKNTQKIKMKIIFLTRIVKFA
jgi:hypothetical protein